ncbi:DUF3793 family protein [Pectinatus frisingensis]|uniref:DUF3793 family protein n=1 Tax=Pectinatus frisingensis TaxID=865 RepID=UPI001E4EC647|nr:DUF3793 family protein [Pectinatus frisingensis]
MEPLKDFEMLLSFHCAPTLAGIKSGSLISINKNKVHNFTQVQKKYRNCLKCNNIYMFTLSESLNYYLVFIYNKEILHKILMEKENQKFLINYGYQGFGNVARCLHYLKIRMHLQKGFPHEIGLFLNYPLQDVQGFIKNNGQNFKYSGQWKVYSNIDEAEKLFFQYAKCCKRFCSCIAAGQSLTDLMEKAV